MEHTGDHSFLLDGFYLLGAALVLVLVFRRFGLGATLGYLIAGVVVGPEVLGLVGGAEEKIVFAEFGIVLLLFIVGLELAPRRLWRMKGAIFGLGLSQVALCGIALWGFISLTTGFSWEAALALGLPLALSSTAQILPMLQSAGRLRTPFGERAFSILLFQDISIIPLITIIAAMSRNPADAAGPPGWQLVLITIAAIIGLILAGRFVIRPLFGLIGGLGEREMFIVAALFTVLASAAVMQVLGLSTALGAFIAGVMLADTPYRHELEADVEPFRSILLGLFFLAVGMMLDLSAIAERPLFVVGMALGLIAIKALIITGLGLVLKLPWRSALALGLLLSQGGEFGFVLFTQAQNALLIDPEASSLFGAVITLSMATTPFLMMATRRIRQAPAGEDKGEREAPSDQGARVIVVGYGRFGQTVGQMLIADGVNVTLIDKDPGMIDLAEEFGSKVYYGDGTRIDLLRQAGAADADMVIYCENDEDLEPDKLRAIKEHFPDLAIFVRAYDRRSLIRLKDAPIDYIVREMMESAITLARAAMDYLGDSVEDIDKAEKHYRERDAEQLDIQKEHNDIRAGRDRVITQSMADRETKPG